MAGAVAGIIALLFERGVTWTVYKLACGHEQKATTL